MNHLFLVRHGENVANLTKEFSCFKVDYSLTPKGVLQAQQTAQYLRNKDVHAIYSSPLKRARETAQIIGGAVGLPVVVLEDLREINVGDLEGRRANAADWRFHNAILDAWLGGESDRTFPGGESYTLLWSRARRAIEQMCLGKSGRNIVAVGHGGLFTVTMKDLCPAAGLQRIRSQESQNCSVTDVLVRAANGRLDCELLVWAAYDHLSGVAAELVRGIPEESDWKK